MSAFVVPGTPRNAASIVDVLEDIEGDLNSVPRGAFLAESIIPEVLRTGLFEGHYVAGEEAGAGVGLLFMSGNAASGWSEVLKVDIHGTGNAYGNRRRNMEQITLYQRPVFGGVVIEWDLSLRDITSWLAPAYAYGHPYSRFIVEIAVEICNSSDTSSTSTDWYRVAGPFYQRGNAVFTTQTSYPTDAATYSGAGGNDNQLIGAIVSGAVLVDAALLTSIIDPVNIDIYGVRVQARAWCSETYLESLTDTRVPDLNPYAYFDLGSSRLLVEHTTAGVLT
jgi:hypothetical protein